MFKAGDNVIINKRPNGSDASISRDFPFHDVIVTASNDTYELESGFYAYEDMVTSADISSEEREDILFILNTTLPDKVKIAAIKSRMEVK